MSGRSDPPSPDLDELARSTGAWLRARRARLTTVESCTGGWIAQVVTSVPGSSDWFERGFVTYSNEAKTEQVGVDPELFRKSGAVSETVAKAMAAGALAHSHADYAIAVTGIAGPDGGSAAKPVGTVWIAWAATNGEATAARFLFDGDRRSIRRQAVVSALQRLPEAFGGAR